MSEKVRHIDYYADELLTGTRRLTDVELGIYWRACSLIYSRGGPVHIDELVSWCSTRRGRLVDIIEKLGASGKLNVELPWISQARAMRELSRAQARAMQRTENGRKGGRPPKEINGSEKLPVISRANLQPITTNHQPKKDARAALKAEFAEWYAVYPHKVAPRAAEQKFEIARRSVSQAELLEGLRRYIATKPSDIAWCYPATWLHNRRWEDQPAPQLSLLNGHDPTGPPPAPIDPRKLNHFDGCTCRNCAQWAAQQGREAQHA